MPRPGSPRHPDVAGDSRRAAQTLDPLLDACAALLLSQHRLTVRLHTAGLIGDRAATAVIAREDQIEATITDLRTRACRRRPTDY